MSDTLESRLDELRNDFAGVEGMPFKHFFCPILWIDEATELCLGHVVNKAFRRSSGIRVVQRKDVDGFYGSVVEAQFEVMVASGGKSASELMFDPNLNRKIRPRITVDGEECEYYPYKGHKGPDDTLGQIRLDDGSQMEVVLKKSPSEVAAAENGNWQVDVDRDYRIAAVATLIKAAHLTLFHMLGYSYALSAAGEYVGRQILGTFYLENREKSLKHAREAADSYFGQFATMVRPLTMVGDPPSQGTAEDNTVFVCRGTSRRPFAMGVFVRIEEQLHCVLVPAFDHPDAVPTYLDFLQNANETLAKTLVRYNRVSRSWEPITEDPTQITWPKKHESFRFA